MTAHFISFKFKFEERLIALDFHAVRSDDGVNMHFVREILANRLN